MSASTSVLACEIPASGTSGRARLQSTIGPPWRSSRLRAARPNAFLARPPMENTMGMDRSADGRSYLAVRSILDGQPARWRVPGPRDAGTPPVRPAPAQRVAPYRPGGQPLRRSFLDRRCASSFVSVAHRLTVEEPLAEQGGLWWCARVPARTRCRRRRADAELGGVGERVCPAGRFEPARSARGRPARPAVPVRDLAADVDGGGVVAGLFDRGVVAAPEYLVGHGLQVDAGGSAPVAERLAQAGEQLRVDLLGYEGIRRAAGGGPQLVVGGRGRCRSGRGPPGRG